MTPGAMIILLRLAVVASAVFGCTKGQPSTVPPVVRYLKGLTDVDQLPEDLRRAWFRNSIDYFSEQQKIAQAMAVHRHIQKYAETQGMSIERATERLLPPTIISDHSIEEYFRQHPGDFGSSLTPATADVIRMLLAAERREEATRELLASLPPSDWAIAFDPPYPPKFALQTKGFPRKGAATEGALEIIEYADFSCPNCRAFREVIQRILDQYGTRVAIVFKFFNAHGEMSQRFSQAALCVHTLEDRFWPLHDYFYENQSFALFEEPNAWIAGAGLQRTSAEDLAKCMDSSEIKRSVAESHAEGASIGIQGTPGLVVGGRPVLPLTTERLFEMIDRAL